MSMFDFSTFSGRPMVRVLVTAVGGPPGRNTVRALAKFKGVELVLADACPEQCKGFEHHVHTLPMCQQDEVGYQRAVVSLIEQYKVDVILPCIEQEILYFSAHLDWYRTEHDVRIPVTPAPRLAESVDKVQLANISKKLGLPTIPTLDLDIPEQRDQLLSWSFPYVVKPRLGHGARGVQFIENQSERDRLLADCSGVLAQKMIPGESGSNYMFSAVLDENGQVMAEFQCRSTGTLFDFGGPATAGEPVAEPELEELGRRLLKHFDFWRGVANFEFKRSSVDGQFYWMDFNPRVWGYSALAEDAGLSFPFLQLCVALNIKVSAAGPVLMPIQMCRDSKGDDYSRVRGIGHRVNQWQGAYDTVRVAVADNETVADNANIDVLWMPCEQPYQRDKTLVLPLPGDASSLTLRYLSMLVLPAGQYIFDSKLSNEETGPITPQRLFEQYWREHEQ